MKKDTARKMLQDYINEQIHKYEQFRLPVHDIIVHQYTEGDEINSYTWRYLVEVAYGGDCEHPWADVMGDGNMKPAKCLKCGKVLTD